MSTATTAPAFTAADLDALPEGDAAVRTLGGIWTKGDGENWHRAQRDGRQKVWPSSKLAPLVTEVIWPRPAAASDGCPSCGAEVVEAIASAPGFSGVEYPTCGDGCGWVGEP